MAEKAADRSEERASRAAFPVRASCWPCLLTALLPAWLPVEARAGDGDRHVITGTIDSRAGLWEQRRRIPLPGIIVSSQTYVVFDGQLDGSLPGTGLHGARFFDIHRLEATGDLTPERHRDLQRIALSGVIASYDRETPAHLAGAGFVSAAEREQDPEPVGALTADGGFVVYAASAGPIAPDSDAVTISAAERDRALAERFDLAGVISSEDARIERVEPDDPDLLLRGTRAVANRVAASLMNPDLYTFIRSDSVDFDEGRSEHTVQAVAGVGITADIPLAAMDLLVNYDVNAAEYPAGDFEGFVNHRLGLEAGVDLRGRGEAYVQLDGRRWRDQRDTNGVDDFQATASGSYEQETTNVALGWRRSSAEKRLRGDVRVARQTSQVDFAAGDDFEQETRSVSSTVAYRLRRRVSLLLDGRYETHEFDARSDSTQYRLRGGVEANLSRRLSGRGVVGYGRRDFDNGSDGDGALSFDGTLRWRPGRRNTITIAAARDIVDIFERSDRGQEPNAFGIQDSARVDWTHDWTSAWSTRSSLGYRTLDPRNSDARVADWQVQTGGSYALTKRTSLSASGAYTLSDDETRGDYDRWTFTLRLDRRARPFGRGRGRRAL